MDSAEKTSIIHPCSYIYVIETTLYYLQSRYYNPAMGRFIGADDYPSTGQGLTGNNMFAYCGNNPVVRSDEGGELWHVAFGAAIGGLISGGVKLFECIKNNNSLGETIGQVLVSAACGAVGGALAATGIGAVGQAVIGGALGAVESAANQMITNGKIDRRTFLTDTAAGVFGGISGGKGASYGSKFMSYHRGQFMKNVGLEGIETAFRKLTNHTWKWAKSNLAKATFSGVMKAFVGNKVASFGLNKTISMCDRVAEAIN